MKTDYFEDLAEYPHYFPNGLYDLYMTMSEEMGSSGLRYEGCADYFEKFEKFGWTFDYGLCGEPHSLTPMNKLVHLQMEYKKYKSWGYNSYDAALNAMRIAFKDVACHPFIYRDSEGAASHVFYENMVLFFGEDIFKK